MSEGRTAPGRVARRNFIKALAAFSTGSIFADLESPSLLGHGFDAPRAATPITDVFMDLNHIHKWDQSNGDTWDPFWADDDSLYAFNCDGRGFGTQPRNLAFNQLQGDGPHALKGRIVNSMDESPIRR